MRDIEVEQLTKVYGKTKAVDGISFNVEKGEICSLFESFYKNPYAYDKLLERFDLSDKMNAYVQNLSGGQRQKLSIILALISNPEIVFLDELTTGLDPQARRTMWEYVRELKEETSCNIKQTTKIIRTARCLD